MWPLSTKSVLQTGACAVLFLFFVACPATAQVLDSVRASTGITFIAGGASSTSEENLKTVGYDDPDINNPTPVTNTLLDFFVHGAIGLNRSLAIAITASRARNNTVGKQMTGVPMLVSSLSADQKVTTTSLEAEYRVARNVFLSVGPAFYKRQLNLIPASSPQVSIVNDTSFGWVFGVDAFVLKRTTAAFAVLVQYRDAGTAHSDATLIPMGSLNGVPLSDIVWPESSTSFSHWFVGLGIGFGR
jgi:hypothetical protein